MIALESAKACDTLAALGRTSDAGWAAASTTSGDTSLQADAFALAVWSFLVEPGDAVGGTLRAALGPADSLRALEGHDEVALVAVRDAGFDLTPGELAAAKARWGPRRDSAAFRQSIERAVASGVRLVLPGDPAWPGGLDDLGVHAPAALWVRGDPACLNDAPAVAIVGCRASTGYGEQVAAELALALAGRGVTVYSGGAYGIDGMAHRATVSSGGRSVAIMAGGVDRYYPAGHTDLLERVAETGAVAAEVACGSTPSRWRFLQRNRVLAAATAATVVVEAGFRSGALNTAGHARSLGRPLGAVPGPITSPASDGCHRLLRDPEVTLVAGPHDVLSAMEPVIGGRASGAPWRRDRENPTEVRVLDALSGRRGRTDDEVASDAGLAPSEARATLAVLELDGQVVERDGGWWRSRAK